MSSIAVMGDDQEAAAKLIGEKEAAPAVKTKQADEDAGVVTTAFWFGEHFRSLAPTPWIHCRAVCVRHSLYRISNHDCWQQSCDARLPLPKHRDLYPKWRVCPCTFHLESTFYC
jgi:hypothetical protein